MFELEKFNDFTKDDFKLRIEKEKLFSVLKEEKLNIDLLLSFLDKQYPGLYDEDVGVWEEYNLREHTKMVLGQFEKYFAKDFKNKYLNRADFRLLLALHDIGKIEAIHKENKNAQHKYTVQYLENFFKSLDYKKDKRELLIALVDTDVLGAYFRNFKDLDEAVFELQRIAKKANIKAKDFLDLLSIFYRVDAGSYTLDSGGLESLDYLFYFDHENWKLEFNEDLKEEISLLYKELEKQEKIEKE